MAKFRIAYIDDTYEVIEAEGVARNNGEYQFWDKNDEVVELIPADRVKSVLRTED
jgi:hypothetical protein